MAELITQAEYARRRGCTKQAVSKAVLKKRISLIDGKVDPEIADREWARRTDPDQQQRGSPEQFAITQQRAEQLELSTSPSPAVDEAEPESSGTKDDPLLVKAKTRTELIRAELLDDELKRKRGALIDADQARKIMFNLARTARNNLLSVPDRIAPLVAATSDAAECHRIIADELRRVCAELTKPPMLEQ